MLFVFRDEARCILQSYAVEQSVEEAEKTCITEDGFARIYASDLVIVIQPEEEVMHISTLKSVYTRTESFSVWENYDAETFPASHLDISYDWWFKHLCDALFEIIEFLESPDTSSETPPITCEETENEEVIKLRQQVEELQGRLQVHERPKEKTIEIKTERLRELEMCITHHNQRIQELRNYREKMHREKEVIEQEIRLLEMKIELEQKGVTSDS